MTPAQLVAAIAVPMIWGLGFTLTRIGLDSFPTMMLVAVRFALAAVVLLPFARLPKGRFGAIFVVAFVSATMQYGITFTGLKYLDASTAIIVVQLEGPFLVLLSVVFLRERINTIRLFGMALAFGGVVYLAGQPRFDDNLWAIAMVATGGGIWAVGQLMISRIRDVGSLTLIAWVAAFAAPQMAIASMIFESGQIESIRTASLEAWAIVAYLGLIMTALGYALWYRLLQTVDMSRVGPILLLLPVTTIASGVLLRGEIFDLTLAIGAVLVISGVALSTLYRQHRERPAGTTAASPTDAPR